MTTTDLRLSNAEIADPDGFVHRLSKPQGWPWSQKTVCGQRTHGGNNGWRFMPRSGDECSECFKESTS